MASRLSRNRQVGGGRFPERKKSVLLPERGLSRFMTRQRWIGMGDLLCSRLRSPMYLVVERSESGRAVGGMSSRSTCLCDQMDTRTPLPWVQGRYAGPGLVWLR